MLAVTTNDIPGWEIERVCGEVFGLTVRSRNAFSQMGAGFKSLLGGELRGMTKALVDSRNEVMNRMFEEARARGGNAIIGMRFDTSEMGDTWTEICAYGTAIVAIPITDAAKMTAAQLGYGGGVPGQFNPGQSGQPQSGQPVYGQPGQPPYGGPSPAPGQQFGPPAGQPGQGQPGQGQPGQAQPGGWPQQPPRPNH